MRDDGVDGRDGYAILRSLKQGEAILKIEMGLGYVQRSRRGANQTIAIKEHYLAVSGRIDALAPRRWLRRLTKRRTESSRPPLTHPFASLLRHRGRTAAIGWGRRSRFAH